MSGITDFYNNSENHVFHLFVVTVKDREHFVNYLKQNQIETLLHYPIAPHKQVALKEFSALQLPLTEQIHKNIVSLPISPVITEKEITQIIQTLNKY